MLTGIRARNIRHWTGIAQITRPVLFLRLQQTTFFHIPAAVIIAIEVRALAPSGSLHNVNLYAGDVIARAGVHADGVAHVDKVGALHNHACLGGDFLGNACCGIAANCHFGFDNFEVYRGG